MNYKEIDTQRIIDYIGAFANGASVDDIILHSGADKLRFIRQMHRSYRVEKGF